MLRSYPVVKVPFLILYSISRFTPSMTTYDLGCAVGLLCLRALSAVVPYQGSAMYAFDSYALYLKTS